MADSPRQQSDGLRSGASEFVVLVDERNRRIGIFPKLTVHHSATPLHRGFSCYVFNRDGRVLITRRSPNKTFPGVWTNSVCGHPGPGERTDAAVRRRMRYELGLKASAVQCVLRDFRYRAEMGGVVEHELCPVYTTIVDSDPDPNPDEVDAYEWAAWDDFSRELHSAPEKFSPWCIEQVDELAAIHFTPPRVGSRGSR